MEGRTILVAVAGLPGSGKSTAAGICAQLLGADWLRTDVIRKELFPQPNYNNPAESAAVHAAFFRRAEEGLRAGRSVVLDATFVLRQSRQRARQVAERCGVDLLLLLVTAPGPVIRQRLAQRTGDASDADFAVYLLLKAEFEPIRGPHVAIDNSQGIGELTAQIKRALQLESRPVEPPPQDAV